MNAQTPQPDQRPGEGAYGSPTPEEEMPPEGAPSGAGAQPDASEPASDGQADPAPEAAPGNAPSSEAELDSANTEEAPRRESFSSESDEEAAGSPEG